MIDITEILHDEIDAIEEMERIEVERIDKEYNQVMAAMRRHGATNAPDIMVEALEAFAVGVMARTDADPRFYDAGVDAAARREALVNVDDCW